MLLRTADPFRDVDRIEASDDVGVLRLPGSTRKQAIGA